MNSFEITAFITLLANALAKVYSKDELALWAVVLTQLADTLATIAAYEEINEVNIDK